MHACVHVSQMHASLIDMHSYTLNNLNTFKVITQPVQFIHATRLSFYLHLIIFNFNFIVIPGLWSSSHSSVPCVGGARVKSVGGIVMK